MATAMMMPGFAYAADPAPTGALGLSVNADGPWSKNLTSPLFDPALRWVPGDVQTRTFYARNGSRDQATLRLRLEPSVQDLYDSGQLSVQLRADEGDWSELDTGWTAPDDMSPGDITQVDIRVEFVNPGYVNNAAQELVFVFRVLTHLTYQGPDKPEPSSSTSPTLVDGEDRANAGFGGPANIARTGGGLPEWVIPSGFGAIVTGFVLLLLVRRKKDEEEKEVLSHV